MSGRPDQHVGAFPLLDRATRAFWRTVGRRVDLGESERWLTAPMSAGSLVADSWLAAGASNASGSRGLPAAGGLLADMAALDGSTFRAAELHPAVREFYEHTSAWRMEVWTQWSTAFQPGGALISRLFGRRVQQLALPTRPLDVALGMDSRVVPIRSHDGQQTAAAWLRTLRATGEYVYSGWYAVDTLPMSSQPSVHVAFPLQSGNVQVFLRPSVSPAGGLHLTSPPGPFGTDGAYVLVAHADKTHAARVPIHESFHVYVDDEGTLRTDHVLRLWSPTVVRLHYKLTPA